MQESQLEELIDKCLNGRASPEEQRMLDEWYESFDSRKGITEGMDKKEKLQLEEKMFSAIIVSLEVSEEKARKQIPFYHRYKLLLLAALVIVLAICWFLYSQYPASNKENTVARLATIIGEEAKIVHEKLPDGSVIWLNGRSSIKYDSSIFLSEREAILEGEAYFEVKRDPQHPFLVHAGKIITQVLGTEFNIRVSKDAAFVFVTVTEGKVAVRNQTQKLDILLPNEQIAFNSKTEAYAKTEVDAASYITWKTGSLYFKERSFGEIASELEKKYNINIDFSSPSPEHCLLTASFDSTVQVKEILTMLCKINSSRLISKSENYIISGHPCK